MEAQGGVGGGGAPLLFLDPPNVCDVRLKDRKERVIFFFIIKDLKENKLENSLFFFFLLLLH